MRVHELAKELGVTSKELLGALDAMGLGGRTASSSVPDEAVPRLRASGGKPVPGAKVKEAVEAPMPTSRKAADRKAAAKRRAEASANGTAPAPAPTGGIPKSASEAPDGTGPAPGPTEPGPDAPMTAAAGPASTTSPPPAEQVGRASSLPTLKIARGATPQDLADKVASSPADVVRSLFGLGEMVTATTSLSDEVLQLVVHELGYEVDVVGVEDDLDEVEDAVDESRVAPRPPVVTVMGHVDHGKTKLLDAIRETDVVSGELGGITQHIGAYQVRVNGREITFIDTPGHEAFTAMRARGAQVTDIAVLVIAADDGVMPQTVEALDHARAAGVPIVVAVNKIDKPEADPGRPRQQMVERGVVPVEWGGDFEFVDVSAKTREGLETLLETILIVADLQELTADPGGRARGTVIEAHLDKGRGPVATVLVQRGTLDVGDALIAGTSYAKIRAMQDEWGRDVRAAGPSKPVQLLGWSSVPNAGDDIREVADEREARHLAQERESRARAAELVTTRPPTLEDLMARAGGHEVPELNVVIKADVQGSLGALTDAFLKLPQDEVRIRIVRRGAGGISENDVQLALASHAIVVGFNVRPDVNARALAEAEGVDLRLYRVIYEAIDDIKQALSGLLKPERQEIEKGYAEVRATFRVPRLGVVAGCYVKGGTITRGGRARIVRDGLVVYDGRVGSLRRFKEDVREVAEGYECGIGIESFQDVKDGDLIEAYEVREVARSI